MLKTTRLDGIDHLTYEITIGLAVVTIIELYADSSLQHNKQECGP